MINTIQRNPKKIFTLTEKQLESVLNEADDFIITQKKQYWKITFMTWQKKDFSWNFRITLSQKCWSTYQKRRQN